MTRDHFIFNVTSEIRFTEQEALLLHKCAESHYDLTCKLEAKNGFIRGLVNQFWVGEAEATEEKPETCALGLTTRQLNLLCKITEQFAGMREPRVTELHNQFVNFFKEAQAAYEEKNGQ